MLHWMSKLGVHLIRFISGHKCTILSVLGSLGLHKNIETSVGSPAFIENCYCNLHRKHVTTLSTEKGIADNVCTGGTFPREIGVQHVIFLRAQLDSTSMSLSLPQPKLMNILDT